MKRLFTASIACVIMAMSACTVTHVVNGNETIFWRDADGTETATYKDHGSTTTIIINKMSKREIIKLIPFPNMDDTESTTPVQFGYHYYHELKLYDSLNVLIDTFSVDTLGDMVDVMPLVFELGGLAPREQNELDYLAAEIAAFWIDPQTDWNLNN